jgi:hypothetical protein
MPDNVSDPLTAIADLLLKLTQIHSQQLEATRAATLQEIEILKARQTAIENAQRSISTIPATSLMSGRWPKRDGDTYGPKPEDRKTAAAMHYLATGSIKDPDAKQEPASGDNPPGDLRSTNVS